MEEDRQFVGFMRRLSGDATLRQEMESNPLEVCKREGLGTSAAAVLKRLVPQLAMAASEVPSQAGTFTWWF